MRVKSGKETQAHPLRSRRANYGTDRVRLPDLTLSFRVFISKRAKYGYTVTPDHRDKGRSASALAVSDRAKFVAAVAADENTQASLFKTGSQPF